MATDHEFSTPLIEETSCSKINADDFEGDLKVGTSSPRGEWLKAYANVVCIMAGTGILQLPKTLEQGGWVSILLIVLIAAMAAYTGRLVIRCLYDSDECAVDGRRRTYAEIGYAAFGYFGSGTVHLFQKSTLLGVSSLYLILSGDFLSSTLGMWEISSRSWILIVAAVEVLPTVFLPTVSELSISSALGALCTAGIVLAVVVVGLMNPPDVAPSHQALKVDGLATAFSAITLSFGGHATFPTLQEGMAHKGMKVTHFYRVLDCAFATLVGMYVLVATVGYHVYGDAVQSPVLDSLSGKVVTALKLIITVHLVMVIPVIFHVIIHEVEAYFNIAAPRTRARYFSVSEVPDHLRRSAFRLLLVGTSTAIAYNVPYFENMMNLIGAVCVAMVVFVLPCVFALQLVRVQLTVRDIAWVCWLVVTIAVGLVGGSIGAKQAISSIQDKIHHHGH